MEARETLGARLGALIESIESLEREKTEAAKNLAEARAEAKRAGWNMAAVGEIMRLRRLTPDERAAKDAALQLYKAAMQMLDGTPLGEFARRQLAPPEMERPREDPSDETPAPTPPPAVSAEEARELGAAAAREGRKILDNPFPALSANRAAWEEGWCAEAGSDGMDIPDAWRAPVKPKKDPPANPPPDQEGGDV